MLTGKRPEWLTFDCYGTLIQWDEGLMAAVRQLLKKHAEIDEGEFITLYDRAEHRLEAERPHRTFRQVSSIALEETMPHFGLPFEPSDADFLTSSIGAMPPFPEVVSTLRALKADGYKLAIISNTDDDVIAGNVAQLGGYIDCVITAQQAGAYKPTEQIFRYAWGQLGIEPAQLVHVCASPHLDLVAARDLQFRAIWVDRGTGRKPISNYQPNEVVPLLSHLPELLRRAFASQQVDALALVP